jgi:hypothetical protein
MIDKRTRVLAVAIFLAFIGAGASRGRPTKAAGALREPMLLAQLPAS